MKEEPLRQHPEEPKSSGSNNPVEMLHAASDNLKAANDNEAPHEFTPSYETVLSGLEAEIRAAPEGSVIFIGGMESQREKGLEMLAEQKGIQLVRTNDGLGTLVPMVENGGPLKTVAYHEDILKEMVFGSVETANMLHAEELLHQSDDPEKAFAKWLDEMGPKMEAEGKGLDVLFKEMIGHLQSKYGHTRTILIDIPSNSALGLALVAFAKGATLDAEGVDRVYHSEKYPTAANRLASIKIDGEYITSRIGGDSFSSRSIYE